jgi:hypothetical protein
MIAITFSSINNEQLRDSAELNISHNEIHTILATKEIPLEVKQKLSNDEIKWLEFYLPKFKTEEYECSITPDFPT